MATTLSIECLSAAHVDLRRATRRDACGVQAEEPRGGWTKNQRRPASNRRSRGKLSCFEPIRRHRRPQPGSKGARILPPSLQSPPDLFKPSREPTAAWGPEYLVVQSRHLSRSISSPSVGQKAIRHEPARRPGFACHPPSCASQSV